MIGKKIGHATAKAFRSFSNGEGEERRRRLFTVICSFLRIFYQAGLHRERKAYRQQIHLFMLKDLSMSKVSLLEAWRIIDTENPELQSMEKLWSVLQTEESTSIQFLNFIFTLSFDSKSSSEEILLLKELTRHSSYSMASFDEFYLMWESRLADNYTTLNSSPSQTDTEVKQAYRKLCLQYHPDKCTTDFERKLAEQTFKELNEAYKNITEVRRFL